MALYLTSDTLIESIKRRGQIPSSQKTFKNADFLDLANEEIMLSIIPEIINKHEDYLLRTESVPLVDSTSNYTIPYRALGNKLYDLQYRDTNDNIYEMVRVPKAHVMDYQNNNISNNYIYQYYIENNEIVIIPTIGSGVQGTLDFIFYMRPNELVESNRVSTITAIDRDTGVISVDFVPDHFSTSIQYDFLQRRPPHKTYSYDITATSVGTTLTFNTTDIPTDLIVGDMIAKAEECMIPQVPSELHMLLAQKVAEIVLDAIGDVQGSAMKKAKNTEYSQNANAIINNRVERSSVKIKSRHGFLRGSSTRRTRRD
jgi:hypothetical protein